MVSMDKNNDMISVDKNNMNENYMKKRCE